MPPEGLRTTASPKVIVNADDLGISPGTNHAVRQAHLHGRLTHASLMSNGDFALDAVRDVIRPCPGLAVGLHVNLTYGRPLTACAALSRNGILQGGFTSILRNTLQGHRALLADAEREIDAQIRWMHAQGIRVDHINSHHHVHMIPAVFRVVKKLALDHGVPRIRIPDESFALSIRVARGRSRMFRNGNLSKFLLMKVLVRVNSEPADRRFFSLLFTGGVSRPVLHRALKARVPLEVMVHPGVPEMDASIRFYKDEQRRYRCSPGRRVELEACLEQGSV